MDYFSKNPKECKEFNLIVGFKTINNILFKEDIEKWKENINVTVTLDVAEEGYKAIQAL